MPHSLALPQNTAVLVTRKSLSSSGWAIIESSAKETVVYQSVEYTLSVGATHSMSALSTASMDRVTPWIEAGLQYEKLNKCKLAYVAKADIQMATQLDVQHKDPTRPPLVSYVVGVSCRQSKL